MTDEAYIFNQTSRERKQIGRNALYKKNGRKSTKCSLPSDNLTKKQLKGLCGTMITYNMKTLSYREFKTYPSDIQQEVLDIHAKHGARLIDFARTMNLSDSNALSNYIIRKGLKSTFRMGKSESPEYVDWLRDNHVEEPKEEEPIDISEEVDGNPDSIKPLREHDLDNVRTVYYGGYYPAKDPEVMAPSDGRLRFDGDIETITNTIKTLLGSDITYHIDISFYKK